MSTPTGKGKSSQGNVSNATMALELSRAATVFLEEAPDIIEFAKLVVDANLVQPELTCQYVHITNGLDSDVEISILVASNDHQLQAGFT